MPAKCRVRICGGYRILRILVKPRQLAKSREFGNFEMRYIVLYTVGKPRQSLISLFDRYDRIQSKNRHRHYPIATIQSAMQNPAWEINPDNPRILLGRRWRTSTLWVFLAFPHCVSDIPNLSVQVWRQ